MYIQQKASQLRQQIQTSVDRFIWLSPKGIKPYENQTIITAKRTPKKQTIAAKNTTTAFSFHKTIFATNSTASRNPVIPASQHLLIVSFGDRSKGIKPFRISDKFNTERIPPKQLRQKIPPYRHIITSQSR
jgi:hypothetical protein